MPFRRTACLFAVVLGLFLFQISSATALVVAGLELEFSEEVDAPTQELIKDSLGELFAASTRYDFIPTERARERLDPVVRDCFTSDCLQRAGRALGADVGLRISVSVEMEIYEWTVDFYDLLAGELVASEEGICELCGRAEIGEQFRASIQGPLAVLNLNEREGGAPLDTSVEAREGITEVRITVIPSDTRIFLDEHPIGEGAAEIDLEPGTYEIRFSHDDYHGLRETLIVTETSPPLLFMRVHLSGGEVQQRVHVTRGDGWVDYLEPNRNLIGLSVLGAGAVVTIASVFLARLHGQPACPGDGPFTRCPDLYNTAGLATTTTIIGTLSMAAGGVLLAWPWLAGDFDEPAQSEPTLSLSPQVGAEFKGFSLSGRF